MVKKDWHPKNHGSFASNHPGKKAGDIINLNGVDQILWPDHCVQGTKGAELVKDLCAKRIVKIFQKGIDKDTDSYSGFFDNCRKKATGLENYLKERGVGNVYVVGLATDYCVKFTALDAVNLGFKTTLIREGCRGVNVNLGDEDKAIAEIKKSGVRIK
ncbi:MAG: bifunctional nicotinamidase/pyrazinamidase [Candidatus Omnitrophica bacterium]|nr:bifunctional nicotinamidase/pyrazinamidase [Candidatus Omnitrophota bacterium]